MKILVALCLIFVNTISLALPKGELEQKAKGCETGKSGEACVPVAYHFEELKNYSEALRFYDLGCSLNDAIACKSANVLRNRLCFAESIISECGKAPVSEKFKVLQSLETADFRYKTTIKSLNEFISDKDFLKALQKVLIKAERPLICSVVKILANEKEQAFSGISVFQQSFGSLLVVNNPKASLICLSTLDLEQFKKIEQALISNPYENWAENPKEAMCPDNECRKKVIEFYIQQKRRLEQVNEMPEIKKELVKFYLATLDKRIKETKKDMSKY